MSPMAMAAVSASTTARSEPGSRAGGRLSHPPAGPAGDLAARRLRLAHRLGDLGERHAEHVGQQEHGPLHRLEPVEHGEEPEPERVGQHGGFVRTGIGDQWLRQPGSDVRPRGAAGRTGCGRGRSGWSPWSATPRAGPPRRDGRSASGARPLGPRPRRRRRCRASGRPARPGGAAPARRVRWPRPARLRCSRRPSSAHATILAKPGRSPTARQARGPAAGQRCIGEESDGPHPVAGHGDPGHAGVPHAGPAGQTSGGGPGEGAGHRRWARNLLVTTSSGRTPASTTSCSSWGRSSSALRAPYRMAATTAWPSGAWRAGGDCTVA